MSAPKQTVVRSGDRTPPTPSAGDLADDTFWQQHLRPEEKLLWTARPPAHFKVNAFGKAIGWFTAFAVVLAILVFVATTEGQTTTKLLGLVAVCAVIGAIFTLGPAKLDQGNRRLRRYAITNQRVLTQRDYRNGRPNSLELRPTTKVFCVDYEAQERHLDHITDDSIDEVIMGFANVSPDGQVLAQVQFERLSNAQVRALADYLDRQGIAS